MHGNWLLAAAFVVAFPASAQMQERVDVIVANVEVVVTDRDGKTVEGLRREDFELSVDGQRTEISNFFAEVISEPEVAEEKRDEPSAAPPPPADPRTVLVFLDLSAFDQPVTRKLLQRSMESFLDQFTKCRGCQVAMYSRRSDGVATLSEPVTDATKLTELFRKEIEVQHKAAVALRTHLHALREKDSPMYERMRRRDSLKQSDALAQVIAQGSRFRGRKVMLLLTSRPVMIAPGNPFTSEGDEPSEFVGRNTAEVRAARSRGEEPRSTRNELSSLASLANAAGISIYPVIAGGLADLETFDAPVISRNMSDLSTGVQALAIATGGRLQPPTNNFELPLGHVIRETQSWYSLGFRVTSDEKVSRITVRVKGRKDLNVRTRASILHLSPHEMERVRLQFGFGEESGGPVNFSASLTPARSGMRRQVAKLEFAIPLASLIWLPDASGHRAEIVLTLRALDERGRRSDLVDIPITLRRKAGDSSQAFRGSQDVELRSGAQELLVILEDRNEGSKSWRTVRIQ